jgi:UDP-glucuronate 4-epimerase
MEFIEALEGLLGKKAQMKLLPMQPGDVPATWADVNDLADDLQYRPGTSVKEGIKQFLSWYKNFYHI